MHVVSEYTALLKAILAQAEQMAAHLPSTHHTQSADILSFLKAYGCKGYPAGQAAHFNIGPWLARQGMPTKRHEGVTIVPYFSDDVLPIALPPQSQTVIPGQCLYTDQVILLYNVDYWSTPELALVLLHEGRHARHWIGPRLAQLPPLDQNDALHETNTWLFTLNILVAWGGKAWEAAVQQEITWLIQQNQQQPQPGQILYDMSPHYWPELDQVFGHANHESIRLTRRRIASLQANVVYWPRRDPTIQPEQVCHSLVTHFYH